jgi:hypothetical protein
MYPTLFNSLSFWLPAPSSQIMHRAALVLRPIAAPTSSRSPHVIDRRTPPPPPELPHLSSIAARAVDTTTGATPLEQRLPPASTVIQTRRKTPSSRSTTSSSTASTLAASSTMLSAQIPKSPLLILQPSRTGLWRGGVVIHTIRKIVIGCAISEAVHLEPLPNHISTVIL